LQLSVKMTSAVFTMGFLALLIIPTQVPAYDWAVCPTVSIKTDIDVEFSDSEKRLICGDPSGDSTQAWVLVPPRQAQFHLKAMLQTRGFHNSTYQVEGNKLIVNLGDTTKIQKITTTGAPSQLNVQRKRHIVGEDLTPQKLDELRDWIKLELQHLGYACPDMELQADVVTGEVVVNIKVGPKLLISKLTSQDVPHLLPGVLRRYDAFKIGQEFDIHRVTLTEKRLLDEDLVSGTYFDEKCEATELVLSQSVLPGPPRLFRIGAGFDTEQGPVFKLSWRHARLGKRGTSIENTILTTYRIQEFRSDIKWYFTKEPSRFFLRPTVEVRREKEEKYELLKSQIGFFPATTWDSHDARWDVQAGPSWHIEKTTVGVGPSSTQNIFLNSQIHWTTHQFEYYKRNPQSGSKLSLDFTTGHQGFLSQVTAQKIELHGQVLWNYKEYDPPLWVFGVRGGIASTLSVNNEGDINNLPQNFRYHLGGSRDIRGFSRKELPTGKSGSLSMAYLGTEIRFLEPLPYRLQPFIFVDGGVLSQKPAHFDWPLYWSPGLGMRWASPIGVFRGEAGHGYIHDPLQRPVDSSLSHWQFYLAYGDEF